MADIKDVIVRIKVEGSEVALARIASIERSRAKLADIANKQTRATNAATGANNRHRKSLDDITLSEKDAEKATRIRQQGVVQLGQQVQDFGIQIQGGQRPLVAFTQQIAQAGFIASQMGGTLGKVGSFIAGPWGTALIIATAVATPLIEALTGIAKASKDVEQKTEVLTRAQELARIKALDYAGAVKELAELIGFSALTSREKVLATIAEAKAEETAALATRKRTAAMLEQQIVQLERIKQFNAQPGVVTDQYGALGAALSVTAAEEGLKKTRKQLADVTATYAQKSEVAAAATKFLADLDADAAKKGDRDAAKRQKESDRRLAASQKEIEQLKEYADAIKEAQDPFIKYYQEVSKIREAQKAGFLTASEASKAVLDEFEAASEAAERLRYQIDSTALSLTDMARVNLDDFAPSVKQTNLVLAEALGYFGRTQAAAETAFEKIKEDAVTSTFPIVEFGEEMGRAAEAFITGTATIKEAVGSMVAFVLKELAKLAIAKFVTSIFGAAANGAAFDASGNPQGIYAKGGAFDGKGAIPFAAGGIVNRPTNFAFNRGGVPALGLMGEAGPEAIMPLKRDKQGKLGVAGASINVQVINNAGAQVTTQSDESGNLKIYVEQARRAVAADIRSGGNLVSSAVERTYGLSRGGAG